MGEADMSLARFEAFCDSLPGLRVMTISPLREREVGYARLKHLLARGVVPSLGHDKRCTEGDILGALRVCREAGCGTAGGPPGPHVTHLFNVTSFHHRDAGLANIALLSGLPDVPRCEGVAEPSVELIGDLQHVSPYAIQLALRCKDPAMLCFVTDAIQPPEALPRPPHSHQHRVGLRVARSLTRIQPQVGHRAGYAERSVVVVPGKGIPLVDLPSYSPSTPSVGKAKGSKPPPGW